MVPRKGIPGSHVIVKSEGKSFRTAPSRKAAGWLPTIQGTENEKLRSIMYRKAGQKVAGAAPGFVIYHTNYSMMATPSNQLEELPS